jgi:hypothetical protein
MRLVTCRSKVDRCRRIGEIVRSSDVGFDRVPGCVVVG